jgi:putative acetyltransferase
MPDLVLRSETATDFDAIDDVVSAAFGSDAEAKLVRAIRASENYEPDLAVVALEGDRVVGHVMVSRVELDDDGTRHAVLSLAPLAVHPDRHRTGVGAALVREVAARADARGEPLIVLEGIPEYYPRFGFEPAAARGIVFHLPEWAPPEAAMMLRLSGYRADVRGTVVYPPAFDEVSHDD